MHWLCALASSIRRTQIRVRCNCTETWSCQWRVPLMKKLSTWDGVTDLSPRRSLVPTIAWRSGSTTPSTSLMFRMQMATPQHSQAMTSLLPTLTKAIWFQMTWSQTMLMIRYLQSPTSLASGPSTWISRARRAFQQAIALSMLVSRDRSPQKRAQTTRSPKAPMLYMKLTLLQLSTRVVRVAVVVALKSMRSAILR